MLDTKVIRASALRIKELAMELPPRQRRDLVLEAATILKLLDAAPLEEKS